MISKSLAGITKNPAIGVSSQLPQSGKLMLLADSIDHQAFTDRLNPQNREIFSNRQTQRSIKRW